MGTKIFNKFEEEKQLKPIEICLYINQDNGATEIPETCDLNIYDNVELMIPRSGDKCDLIKAWNDGKESLAVAYLGNWNDGIIE